MDLIVVLGGQIWHLRPKVMFFVYHVWSCDNNSTISQMIVPISECQLQLCRDIWSNLQCMESKPKCEQRWGIVSKCNTQTQEFVYGKIHKSISLLTYRSTPHHMLTWRSRYMLNLGIVYVNPYQDNYALLEIISINPT